MQKRVEEEEGREMLQVGQLPVLFALPPQTRADGRTNG
jgi:hypothetical protein